MSHSHVHPTPPARLRAPLGDWARLALRDRGILVNVVFVLASIVLVVVAAFTSPAFLTQDNITNLLSQIATPGLLSVGMLIVILTAGIDLSVGSVVALTGVMSAGMSGSMPLPVALFLAILVGTGCGVANGVLIARFGIAPFVVTLAGLTTFRGLGFVYSQIPIAPEDPSFLWLGSKLLGPVPLVAVIMLAVFALAWIFVNRTTVGRALVAIGGNPDAARLAGISVRRHLVLAYGICGFTAAVAGVILASRVGIAQPSVGVGFELDAIAACVIGGASFMGGRGSLVGTLGGVVLLGLINNLQNLYNVQSYWQQVFKGLIIVAVVLARRAGAREGGG
ncbi:MAG TPA: ABC transporter permease [Gaiellaceae bacterium]|nr:ABC transporter permease [Gaiellaceae bacterium]